MSAAVRLTPLASATPELLAAWERLAERSSQDNPFAEPAFAVPMARVLPLGSTVALLHVHQAGELLLALPVRPVRRLGRVPLPALAGWDSDYAFLGVPLLAAGAEVRAWRSCLLGLGRTPGMLLPLHPTQGSAWDALSAAAAELGMPLRVLAHGPRAAVHRRPDNDYLDGRLSGSSRKELRRLRRRLAERCGGEVVVVDRSGSHEGLATFLTLERSGWKGRAGTALGDRAGHAELMHDLLDAWGERLQLLVLEAGGRPVAAQLNLLAGRTLYAFKIGYDEQLATFSPGLQLMLDAMASFHDDPRVDLLDSCATPGHDMAERLFPDRRALGTVHVARNRLGRTSAWAYSRLSQRSISTP